MGYHRYMAEYSTNEANAFGGADCTECDTSANSDFCNGRGNVTDVSACNECTCENQWTPDDNCKGCAITVATCNNHGSHNKYCSGCTCQNQWTVVPVSPATLFVLMM